MAKARADKRILGRARSYTLAEIDEKLQSPEYREMLGTINWQDKNTGGPMGILDKPFDAKVCDIGTGSGKEPGAGKRIMIPKLLSDGRQEVHRDTGDPLYVTLEARDHEIFVDAETGDVLVGKQQAKFIGRDRGGQDLYEFDTSRINKRASVCMVDTTDPKNPTIRSFADHSKAKKILIKSMEEMKKKGGGRLGKRGTVVAGPLPGKISSAESRAYREILKKLDEDGILQDPIQWKDSHKEAVGNYLWSGGAKADGMESGAIQKLKDEHQKRWGKLGEYQRMREKIKAGGPHSAIFTIGKPKVGSGKYQERTRERIKQLPGFKNIRQIDTCMRCGGNVGYKSDGKLKEKGMFHMDENDFLNQLSPVSKANFSKGGGGRPIKDIVRKGDLVAWRDDIKDFGFLDDRYQKGMWALCNECQSRGMIEEYTQPSQINHPRFGMIDEGDSMYKWTGKLLNEFRNAKWMKIDEDKRFERGSHVPDVRRYAGKRGLSGRVGIRPREKKQIMCDRCAAGRTIESRKGQKVEPGETPYFPKDVIGERGWGKPVGEKTEYRGGGRFREKGQSRVQIGRRSTEVVGIGKGTKHVCEACATDMWS